MWGQKGTQPPIPFRQGGGNPNNNRGNQNQGRPAQSGWGRAPGMGLGNQTGNQNTASNFGMMVHGVSQNMQQQFINHICKLEPLIVKELKGSKYNGTITNMAKLNPPKRQLCIVIDTSIIITEQKVDVRLKVDKNFPNNAPKLFFKQPVEHNFINKQSLEVMYNNYYQWGNNSKVTSILLETEKYFNKDSPFSKTEQEKMRKIMVRVNEQSFRNLVEMNLDVFYNKLSTDEKEQIKKDQFKCGEYLKKTSQYKNLEQALRILVKCNSNLYDSIITQRSTLKQKVSTLNQKSEKLSESKMNLVTIYNTANLLQQRFTKLNVITHLENTIKRQEEACNPDVVKAKFKELNSTGAAEAYLEELVRQRKEINKNAIICEKLKTGRN